MLIGKLHLNSKLEKVHNTKNTPSLDHSKMYLRDFSQTFYNTSSNSALDSKSIFMLEHLPENIFVVSGGVSPLDREPIVKIVGGGLSEY